MTVVADAELAQLFASGDVIVDTWTPQVRRRLHVADPLVDVAVEAISTGRSFVATGVPGDGKSHLLWAVRDRLGELGQAVTVVERPSDLPVDPSQTGVLMLTDISALGPEHTVALTSSALESATLLLIAINEGPLDDVAQVSPFFESVRAAAHRPVFAWPVGDDPLVVNLSGRQMVHSALASQVLRQIIENVGPCRNCGDTRNCPRVQGAQHLRESPLAQERLLELLALAADGENRMTPRDIWAFLLSLFFDGVCPRQAGEADQFAYFWWMRVFDGTGQPKADLTAAAIRNEFDPVRIPRSSDSELWRREGPAAEALPQWATPPKRIALTDRQAAVDAFVFLKRQSFFFDESWQASESVVQSSPTAEFQTLVKELMDGEQVIALEKIARAVNSYRSGIPEDQEIVVARHHKFDVRKRPSGFLASGRVSIDKIAVELPFQVEAAAWPDSGFIPREIHVIWRDGGSQPLVIDASVWKSLKQRRGLSADREQEALDSALDGFFSEAPIAASISGTVEFLVPTDGTRRQYRVRATRGRQSIEKRA